MSYKIFISVFLGIAAAIGLVIFFADLKIEDSVTKAVRSRSAFIAQDIASSLELGLGLGLDLGSLNDAQAIIAKAAGADRQINAIEIFDETGAIVFAAGPDGKRSGIPADWLRLSARNTASGNWSLLDSRALVTGLVLTNSFGKTVGGIALSFSRQALDAKFAAILAEILGWCLKVMAVALAAAMLAVLMVVWPIRRSFRQAIGQLDDLREDAAAAPAAATGELERVVAEFRDRASLARRRLNEADRTLSELGAAEPGHG